ncbi:MAG: SMI1/KNR4 family protein [Rubrivivax sp.]
MRPWEKLHARWIEHGYEGGTIRNSHLPLDKCGAPLPSEESIQAIEQRLGLPLPADFRDHLLQLPLVDGDGIDGGDELLVFWTAERVATVAELNYRQWYHPGRSETYLVFCDYLLDCWAWAIECGPNENHGKIALLSSPESELFVFQSFEELVEAYVSASDDLEFACYGAPRRA